MPQITAVGRVEERVPDLHVGVAVILNLACVIVFFLFVQRLSSGLRPGSLMLRVGDQAHEVIEQVYPQLYDPAQPEQAVSAVLPGAPAQTFEFTGRSGVVMAFGVAELVRVAREADAIVGNLAALVDAVNRARPSGAKGQYLKGLTIASTMGPGIRVDLPQVLAAAAAA